MVSARITRILQIGVNLFALQLCIAISLVQALFYFVFVEWGKSFDNIYNIFVFILVSIICVLEIPWQILKIMLFFCDNVETV